MEHGTSANTLTTALIRCTLTDGTLARLTLPGVLAALMRGEVAAFAALRPHQRHAWHAFLAQLGAVALLRAGITAPPKDEAAWCALLRALSPGYADDAPWCLVAPPDRPALLQPPLPDGDLSALKKNTVVTPDALDMLVTSRNHDLKSGVMAAAGADDWLFALVTLQTMEGYFGSGNYGISRMNSGYGNRPAIGLAPPGGLGAHLRRDIARLLAMQGCPPLSEGYAVRDGLALVWLCPWDGTASLSRSVLDPLYIEVCRRVRLLESGGRLAARIGGSKVARIAPSPGGVTGDPWTPIRRDKEGQKALTVDARGFDYRPLVELLFPQNGDPAPLQIAAPEDAAGGLELVARALVRGEGRTDGYHERRVVLSRIIKRRGAISPTDPAAQAAHDRVRLAGEMARILRFALLVLFENGPDKVKQDNDAALGKAKPFLARFERAVDLTFFDALGDEMAADDQDQRTTRRASWVQGLLRQADALLTEADQAAAKASHRRYRARVAARAALHGGARRNENLRGYLPLPKPEESDDAA